MRDDPVVLTGAAILLVGGIILAYPIVLVVILGAAALWYTATRLTRTHQARVTRHRELLEHADREHALVLQGDPAGVYGNYPPAA